MKKKILTASTLVILACSGMCFNSNSMKTPAILGNINVEALADTETKCTSSSNNDTGRCKKNVGTDASGDSCVTPGFWDKKNCDGVITIEI